MRSRFDHASRRRGRGIVAHNKIQEQNQQRACEQAH